MTLAQIAIILSPLALVGAIIAAIEHRRGR